MKLEDKKVLVVGTGISGIAATELLVGQQIDTVLFDGNKELDKEKLYAKSEMISFLDSLVAPLSLINALIVASADRARYDLQSNFKKLEDIWTEYEVYEKAD